MTNSYFRCDTLDDLMHDVIQAIQSDGESIDPRKGACKELRGVLLELSNPRARLSRTETRGKLFSCLAEFCWYMAGSNQLDFISYYIPEYKRYAEGDVIFGAYGRRFFNFAGINQVTNVIDLLRREPDSRRAVIQLFAAGDIAREHNDVPCTCALQFMIRDGALHMVTFMRSNDVYLGLPHDIFCFTMLQELMARTLGAEVGNYKHAVGSLHLYEHNLEAAQQFLDEGFQSTKIAMPTMPEGDPWSAIEFLLKAETTIRAGEQIDAEQISAANAYWADLIRLLQVYRFSRDNECDQIADVRGKMASSTYEVFIDQRLSECRKRLMESHD